MKLAILLILLTLLPVSVPAQTPGPPPDSGVRDIEVLKHLEEEYLRAEIEDDTAIAGTILADDYVGLKPDGTSSTKAEVLSRLERHERRQNPYLITATNMREHLYGDTACVTYTKVYTKPGARNSFSENVLHLLIRHNGIWHLQLSSPLPSPKPVVTESIPR